jgi:hypothetical protein
MSSIHDSLLTGYIVNGSDRSVILHTEPHPGGGTAFVDVVFRGVAAYHFEGDCLQNIVFGVDEVPAEQVVGDGTAFLERFQRTGWPPGWNPKRESPTEFLSRPGLKIYELHCSYGMAGWIAAESMERRELVEPA